MSFSSDTGPKTSPVCEMTYMCTVSGGTLNPTHSLSRRGLFHLSSLQRLSSWMEKTFTGPWLRKRTAIWF